PPCWGCSGRSPCFVDPCTDRKVSLGDGYLLRRPGTFSVQIPSDAPLPSPDIGAKSPGCGKPNEVLSTSTRAYFSGPLMVCHCTVYSPWIVTIPSFSPVGFCISPWIGLPCLKNPYRGLLSSF